MFKWIWWRRKQVSQNNAALRNNIVTPSAPEVRVFNIRRGSRRHNMSGCQGCLLIEWLALLPHRLEGWRRNMLAGVDSQGSLVFSRRMTKINNCTGIIHGLLAYP
jgi:hypothetical protein